MYSEHNKAADTTDAGLIRNTQAAERMGAGGVFTVKCHDAEGNLKWEDSFHNLVVNVGLKDMNDKYFSGSSYTAAWYLGLVDNAGFSAYAAGDTLASHAGWAEESSYSGNRPSVTFGSATTADPSVITNSASPSSFSMTGTATIRGAFLASAATGTSGVLFSAGDFTGGSKTVANGDTLSVTYTFSLDAA